MKNNTMIYILLLIIAPIEIIATVITIGFYRVIVDETISDKLIDKL